MDQTTLIKDLESIRYTLIESVAEEYTIEPIPLHNIELTIQATYHLAEAIQLLKKREEKL